MVNSAEYSRLCAPLYVIHNHKLLSVEQQAIIVAYLGASTTPSTEVHLGIIAKVIDAHAAWQCTGAIRVEDVSTRRSLVGTLLPTLRRLVATPGSNSVDTLARLEYWQTGSVVSDSVTTEHQFPGSPHTVPFTNVADGAFAYVSWLTANGRTLRMGEAALYATETAAWAAYSIAAQSVISRAPNIRASKTIHTQFAEALLAEQARQRLDLMAVCEQAAGSP